jgi:hypothetical protein
MVRTRSQAAEDPTYSHESIQGDNDDEYSTIPSEEEEGDVLEIQLNDSIDNDEFYQNLQDPSILQFARILRHEINVGIKNSLQAQVQLTQRLQGVVEEEEVDIEEEYDDDDDSSEPSTLQSTRVNTFEIPSGTTMVSDEYLQAEDFQTLTVDQLRQLCCKHTDYTGYDGTYVLSNNPLELLPLLTKIPRDTIVKDCPICMHAAWIRHELVCCHQILCDHCYQSVQGVCPYCRHS